MKEFDLKKRTQQYAIDILFFLEALPQKYPYTAFINQLTRASLSVGANYRAAQRAKSTADFINKLKIVEEEADECLYFLEVLNSINSGYSDKIISLHKEGEEILKIIVTIINKARKNPQTL
ncbi:four helix bundle protein [Elizabethkingia meningoseptica]|uniref:four helix bundle protein n=1 Tax=Elizabethkingia meningoseptica TaxID=238 RepID=UPI002012E1FB|nr:four helix bundle protein [Elizabethkingia meningoseptica]MCL1676313.1 four helix bundle protein [Elizabethkingia meningoseptica]MCL1687787.1 four helix bundle protein [Elizabethkingia meningoseptica]